MSALLDYEDEIAEYKHARFLLDGNRGIYLPQCFAENFAEVWGIDAENKAILLAGPDHAEYWDAWDEVLNTTAEWDGATWSLMQDADLFAVVYE